MTALDVGHHAAQLLAPLWDRRHSPAFYRHLDLVYGVRGPELPVLRGVVLCEVSAGNIRHGWVQSVAIRWWVADERGFRAVAPSDAPPEPRDYNAAGDAGRLYSGWLAMAFFVDGDRVAVRGRLGPEVHGVMVGRIALVDGELAFTEVQVAPRPGVSLGPGSPVVAELELRGRMQVEQDAAPDPGGILPS
jgi:hypothetical protein